MKLLMAAISIRESKDGDGMAAEQAMRKLALLDTTGILLELLSRSEKQAVEGLLTQHALVTKDDKGLVAPSDAAGGARPDGRSREGGAGGGRGWRALCEAC